jgi:DnaJ-class molecular chaperone
LNPGGSRRRASAEPQGADSKHALRLIEVLLFSSLSFPFFRISLEDLYSGSTKTVSINRDVVCTNCKG